MIIRTWRKLNKKTLWATSFSSRRHEVRLAKSNAVERRTVASELRHLASSRSFSSSAEADNIKSQSSSSSTFFPWRHDPTLPERILLERDGNDYSGSFNPTTRDPPVLRKFLAAREMNVSGWDALPIPFYEHPWETELAGNFAVAFGLAMEELLRSLFRVPVKNEGGIVSVDTSAAGRDGLNNARVEDDSDLDDNEYLNGMMDKKLLQRYRSTVDSHHEDVHLKFSLRPVEAKLQHMFAVPVPGLTRDLVEENPYVRASIYRLQSAYNENGFDEHYFDLLTDFARVGGPDRRTVVAEAAIRCEEFFQVKDYGHGNTTHREEGGRVVRGMEDGDDEEEAVHVVRFEVVTDARRREDGGGRDIGNWKITDVDDLLEGNVFH